MNSYCLAFLLPQPGPTNRWLLAPPPPPLAHPSPAGRRRRTFLHHHKHQQPRQQEVTAIRSYRSEKKEESSTTSTTVSPNFLDPHNTAELSDKYHHHHHHPPPPHPHHNLHHHPNSALTPAYLQEEFIEKLIYRCRFMTIFAVLGSLMGSIICFLKGCVSVFDAYAQHSARSGKTILVLVEAIDVYLLGTVMLVFGMGLYELFISNFDVAKTSSQGSNLLGLFKLSKRPKWLEIQSVDELKTKVGHVIVMVLLVGMFEKSKKVTISSTNDLLCFAASILLSSSCLYLLSKLHSSKQSKHA